MAAALAWAAAAQQTAPWSMGNGNAQRTGASPLEGPRTGSLKWAFELGTRPVFDTFNPVDPSAPIAVAEDGTVFVGAQSNVLFAFDGGTGAIKWTRPIAGTSATSLAIGPRGTLFATASERDAASSSIVAYALALDAVNGSILWNTMINGELKVFPSASDLIVSSDGTIYFRARVGVIYAWHIFALNSTTGAIMWDYSSPGIDLSSAAVDPQGQAIYVAASSTNDAASVALIRITNSGVQVWNKTVPGANGLSATSIGPDGTLYYGFSSLGRSWPSLQTLAPRCGTIPILHLVACGMVCIVHPLC